MRSKAYFEISIRWLKNEKINVLNWVPQSPDLNPIENLWCSLKQKIAARKPSNLLELKRHTKEEWENFDPSICKKLVESMPKRCALVIEAKGRHIKY